jgi:hypothetical protein
MKIHRYPLTLLDVPADLRADPDGDWSYEGLVSAVGLDPDAAPCPVVAALYEPWRSHPAGAAVVASPGEGWLAVIECASSFATARPEMASAPARSVGRAA